MVAGGQDCLEVKMIHAVFARRAAELCLHCTIQLCGWEVKAAMFKLTLIKRIQYSLLITLHELNLGQAGWISLAK